MADNIHEAVGMGNISAVKNFLSNGIDINLPVGDGWCPIHVAADVGNIKMIELLIEHGANLNATRHGGFTPLFIAAQLGHLDIVTKLVKSGANIEFTSDDGATALHVAATNDHLEIVDFLIGAEANINACTKTGGTPLAMAVELGNIDVVRLLVNKGADIEAANKDGFTPLHMAAQKGRREAVAFLLEKGANVDVRNNAGSKPDDIAHLHGYTELVELISSRRVKKPENGTYCSKCGRGVIMSWTCPKCGKLLCDTCSGLTTTKPEINQGFTVQKFGGGTASCPYCDKTGLAPSRPTPMVRDGNKKTLNRVTKILAAIIIFLVIVGVVFISFHFFKTQQFKETEKTEIPTENPGTETPLENPGLEAILQTNKLGGFWSAVREHSLEFKQIQLKFINDLQTRYMTNTDGKKIIGYSKNDFQIFTDQKEYIDSMSYFLDNHGNIGMPQWQKSMNTYSASGQVFRLLGQSGEPGKKVISSFNINNRGFWKTMTEDPELFREKITQFVKDISKGAKQEISKLRVIETVNMLADSSNKSYNKIVLPFNEFYKSFYNFVEKKESEKHTKTSPQKPTPQKAKKMVQKQIPEPKNTKKIIQAQKQDSKKIEQKTQTQSSEPKKTQTKVIPLKPGEKQEWKIVKNGKTIVPIDMNFSESSVSMSSIEKYLFSPGSYYSLGIPEDWQGLDKPNTKCIHYIFVPKSQFIKLTAFKPGEKNYYFNIYLKNNPEPFIGKITASLHYTIDQGDFGTAKVFDILMDINELTFPRNIAGNEAGCLETGITMTITTIAGTKHVIKNSFPDKLDLKIDGGILTLDTKKIATISDFSESGGGGPKCSMRLKTGATKTVNIDHRFSGFIGKRSDYFTFVNWRYIKSVTIE